MNYLYLKHEGAALKPDLVIQAFLPINDFRDDSKQITREHMADTNDPSGMEGKVYPQLNANGNLNIQDLEDQLTRMKKEKQSTFLRKLVKRSAFIHWFKEKWALARRNLKLKESTTRVEKKSPLTSLVSIPVNRRIFLKNPGKEWEDATNLEKELIRSIRDFAQNLQAKYLLVSLADGLRVEHQLEKEKYWNERDFVLDQPEQILARISQELNIAYTPFLPAFIEKEKENPISISFTCDGHWNKEGHEWAADVLFDTLIKSDLIPKK